MLIEAGNLDNKVNQYNTSLHRSLVLALFLVLASLQISVKLYNLANKTLLSSASTTADLTLDFDSEVLPMITKLLEDADSKLTVLAEDAAEKAKAEEASKRDVLEIKNTDLEMKEEAKTAAKSGFEVFFDTGLSLGIGDKKDILSHR